VYIWCQFSVIYVFCKYVCKHINYLPLNFFNGCPRFCSRHLILIYRWGHKRRSLCFWFLAFSFDFLNLLNLLVDITHLVLHFVQFFKSIYLLAL
jgi:hypothetical protein